MKSTKVLLFVFLVLVVGSLAPLPAQGTTGSYVPYGCIQAQKGDGFWRITKRELSTTEWIGLYKLNPKTQDGKKRKFTTDPETGWPYVYVGNGELICGFDKLGFVPEMATASELESMGFHPTFRSTSADGKIVIDPNSLKWLLLLIPLTIVGLVGWAYKRPNNWRPMVQGGVRNTEHAEALLTQRATNNGLILVPGSQERVRISGIWATQHNGIPVPVPHSYNQERAWRGRFRQTNGMERVGYMLQACGNDVTFGGARYIPGSDARVEEGWGEEETHTPVVQPPTPQTVPAQAQAAQTAPAPEPIPVPTPAINPSGEFVRTKDAPPAIEEEEEWEIAMRPASDGKPKLIEFKNLDVKNFTIKGGKRGISVRYNETPA